MKVVKVGVIVFSDPLSVANQIACQLHPHPRLNSQAHLKGILGLLHSTGHVW